MASTNGSTAMEQTRAALPDEQTTIELESQEDRKQGTASNTPLFPVAIFEAGSAVCGSAPSMNALIVGRAFCGLGGSGMYIGTMTIIATMTTTKERPIYMGLVGITYAIGSICGPIIGGAFADSHESWRWAFYLCLLIIVPMAPVYIVLIPSMDLAPGKGIGAVTCFVMFGSLGGSVWAWDSGPIIALIVVSACCIVLFALQQSLALFTTPETRLFPMQFLKSWEMILLFAQMASSMGSVILTLYFLPLYFQFVHNDSALGAGVKLLPFIATLAFALIASGAFVAKIPAYMLLYCVCSALALAGGVLLRFIDFTSSMSYVMGVSVLVSFGAGLYAQTSFTVAQTIANSASIPAATTFIGIAQLGGTNICLVVSNSVFFNRATEKLAAVLPNQSRATIVNAVSGVGSNFIDSLPPERQETVIRQLVAAIQDVFYLVIAAGAFSLLMSAFMKRERLGGRSGAQTPAEIEHVGDAKGTQTPAKVEGTGDGDATN